MATKINSKTTLKQIKQYAMDDFGIELTNGQAKEIKASVRDGVAVWHSDHYITTRGTDDVNAMRISGVQYMAYKTFYSRKEWNEAVRQGLFS